MKQCIFILGMHRSGTSALGGALNIMGLEFGSNLMAANEDNPKGYFENNFVYELNRTILSENNSSWSDYNFNIEKIDKAKRLKYINEAKSIINSEFKYSEKFVIKDPRICLLFPIWEEACKELNLDIKVILPYRNPLEVANSLKKRNIFSIEQSLILWTHHVLSAEYYSRKYDRLFLPFNKLVNEVGLSTKILSDFIGVSIDKETNNKINNFLDKKIKNNNISIKNFTKETPPFLQNIISFIKKGKFEDREKLEQLRKDFYYSLDFFHHKEIKQSIQDLEKVKQINSLLENDKHLLKENIKKYAVDNEFYLNTYPDIKDAKLDPSTHYAKHGFKEERKPNNYIEQQTSALEKIKDLNKIILEKENLLKIKKNKVEELNNKIVENTNVVNLLEKKNISQLKVNEEQIVIRDKHIAEQIFDKNNYKEKYHLKEEEFVKVQNNISEINKLLDLKEGTIGGLNQTIIENNNEINLLEKKNINQLKLNEEQIVIRDKHISELVFEKNNYKEKYHLKEEELVKVQNNISEINKQLEEKANVIEEQNNKILFFEKTLLNKQSKIEVLNNNLNKLEQSLIEKENEFINTHNVISKIEKQLEEKENIIKLKNNDKINIEKELNNNKNKLSDLAEQLLVTNKKIDIMNNSKEELENLIKLKEEEIKDLHNTLLIEKNRNKELNKNIEEVIEDLATIKESRTWKIASTLKKIKKQ